MTGRFRVGSDGMGLWGVFWDWSGLEEGCGYKT
mgnify:CR=1 FL=1